LNRSIRSPAFVPSLAKSVGEFSKYQGRPELLAAICGWITRRYSVDLTPDHCDGFERHA
jgi:aspartate/methionine/tyrosine aminotransferase